MNTLMGYSNMKTWYFTETVTNWATLGGVSFNEVQYHLFLDAFTILVCQESGISDVVITACCNKEVISYQGNLGLEIMQNEIETKAKSPYLLWFAEDEEVPFHDITTIWEETAYCLIICKIGGRMEGSFIYNSLTCDEYKASGLCEMFNCLLAARISKNPKPIRQWELVYNETKEEFLSAAKNHVCEWGEGSSLLSMFMRQVHTRPEKIVLEIGEEELTYRELNVLSNVVCQYLSRQELSFEQPIGIAMSYSKEMVISIIALLKCGIPYLLTDISHPAKRICTMLTDCNIRYILARTEECPAIDVANHIYVDQLTEGIEISGHDIADISHIATAEDLCIIFTSGTSGYPKCNWVSQNGIANYILWRTKQYGISDQDRILQLISPAFDGFISNFFTALCNGATLVMPSANNYRNFKVISNLIYEKKITNLSLVPLMYEAILNEKEVSEFSDLKMVILAGEKSSSALIHLSNQKVPGVILVNEYGPSENCVATMANIHLKAENTAIIGKAVVNHKVLILNESDMILPVGVFGELCVSGIGVTRGYLSGEAAVSKLIRSPYFPSEIMYKTGDIARRLPNGDYELAGRRDSQIKVNGYRIEADEINMAIMEHPNIQSVYLETQCNEKGYTYIVIYFKSQDGNSLMPESISEFISAKLPAYMIPSRYIQVNSFPMSVNGKIDKEKLKSAENQSGFERKEATEEKQSNKEIKNNLLEIWKTVLKQDAIDADKSFFEHGGTSLLIMDMYSEIDKRYPDTITMAVLFEQVTINQLAKYIDKQQDILHDIR